MSIRRTCASWVASSKAVALHLLRSSSQEMATLEDEFRAAAKFFYGLKKMASVAIFHCWTLCHVYISCFYFPSDRVFIPAGQMLRFYAYSRQATEGPCTQPIPHFWKLIEIVKWNAWKKLGNMPKEEAMTKLIDLVKQVSFVLLEFHIILIFLSIERRL